ncbi:MAG: SIS domain-containing protein [Thermoguttaceae bacterium]
MNLTDPKYKNFALVQEMLQTPGLIAQFDFGQTVEMAEMVKQSGRLFLTGEGSSRIFPAKSLIYEVRRRGVELNVATEGSYQAQEYSLTDWVVFAASNSGQTKETVALFAKLIQEGHNKRLGMTANPGTKLCEMSNGSLVLSCGKEKAVAATKSVVEQALVYRSLLCNMYHCGCRHDAKNAADLAQQVLNVEYDPTLIAQFANAPVIYFAGRNDGVAEELTLKTNEITRKKSDFLEGTYLLHGVEEVMNANEVVVLINPFESECAKIKELLVDRIGITVVAIAANETIFPTIKIPQLTGYDMFLQLLAGWNLLVQIGVASAVNLDKPERARKIGNEFVG